MSDRRARPLIFFAMSLAAANVLALWVANPVARAKRDSEPGETRPEMRPAAETPGAGTSADAAHHAYHILDLEWLAGTWEGDHFGDWSEYTLSSSHGNAMLGAFRVVNKEGKLTVAEYDLIEETPQGIAYHFAIYGPGMVPLKDTPFGSGGTYWLDFVEPGKAIFVNRGKGTARKTVLTAIADSLKSEVFFEKNGKESRVVFWSKRTGVGEND